MSLSDWEVFSINNDGSDCDGIFKNPKNGDYLTLYKNWLYVRSDMWKPDRGYIENTIAQINNGNVNMCGFEISAERSLQNGIFVFASCDYGKDASYFAGLSVSPWKNMVHEVLKSLGRKNECDYTSHMWCDCSNSEGHHYIQNASTREKIIYHDESKDGPMDYSDKFVGILPQTLNAFLLWLKKQEDIEYNSNFSEWFKRAEQLVNKRMSGQPGSSS